MSEPLLTLGTFSFQGLESPERILLKSKQRIIVHHLGSGLTLADSLGDDCEIVSFRGVFSGANTAARIRSIEQLRVQGAPIPFIWDSKSLFVVIQELDLIYSSSHWVAYRLSCSVVRSAEPWVSLSTDLITASPNTQVQGVLSLLQNTRVSTTSEQISALVELAALRYDIAPAFALQQARQILDTINNELTILDLTPWGTNTSTSEFPRDETSWFSESISKAGIRTSLMLARNRLMNITVHAVNSSQR